MPSSLARRLGSAAALAALVIAPLAVSAPAEAAQAAPTNLSPSGDVSSNTPTLSWTPSQRRGEVRGAGRQQRRLQLARRSPPPPRTTGRCRRRCSPRGDQYFRVRAFNSAGSASSWSAATFTIASFAAPDCRSRPSTATSSHQPEDPPLLTWDGTQGATEYTVQVDKEGDWVGALRVQDADHLAGRARTRWRRPSVPPGPPTSGGSRPRRPPASSPPGPTRPSFAVRRSTRSRSSSPDDSPDNEIEDVVLDWDPVPGAQYYELRVATDHDFTNVVDDPTKVYGTRYSPPVTYKNNQYYWQVRAVDLSGNPTDWSRCQDNFNRVWPDTPGGGLPRRHRRWRRSSATPYFQWTPVQHATPVRAAGRQRRELLARHLRLLQIAGTTYTPYLGAIPRPGAASQRPGRRGLRSPPGAVTYWRVRPLDRPQSGSPAWVLGLFSADAAVRLRPGTATTFSPANGATVDDPDPVVGARSAAPRPTSSRSRTGSAPRSRATSRRTSTSYTPVDEEARPDQGSVPPGS